ncbi:DUF4349 domain-containing protein [Candidatus Woesebacteria bacterium]|nr:DUF4349 domain-containing protein [Candidatus Woesebacteria bacterium]
MAPLIGWIKSNKLSVILIAVVLYLVLSSQLSSTRQLQTISPARYANDSVEAGQSMGMPSVGVGKVMESSMIAPEFAPTDTTNRLVITDSSLSLKVNDVPAVVSQIETAAVGFGGHLVDSNVARPEGASTGSITVRVPSQKRAEALAAFKSYGVKTVMEHVSGTDITDQYVDNAERLRILETTKAKFEAILSRAENVTEMLSVQQQLLSVQSQIDGIKGQQKYLEGSASLSRVTIYLSTDELALPYAPDTAWRPELVFKEAVRSFIQTIRGVLSSGIWLAVYSPIVLVFGALYLFIRRLMKKG